MARPPASDVKIFYLKFSHRPTGRLCPRSISSELPSKYQTLPRNLLYILFPLCVNDKSKSKCLWIRKKWDRSNRNWCNNFCRTRFQFIFFQLYRKYIHQDHKITPTIGNLSLSYQTGNLNCLSYLKLYYRIWIILFLKINDLKAQLINNSLKTRPISETNLSKEIWISMLLNSGAKSSFSQENYNNFLLNIFTT